MSEHLIREDYKWKGKEFLNRNRKSLASKLNPLIIRKLGLKRIANRNSRISKNNSIIQSKQLSKKSPKGLWTQSHKNLEVLLTN